MALPRLADEKADRIRGASPEITNAQLAAELGVSERSVTRYRKAARKDREEAAREVVARHVEENIPDALADLTDLRRMARSAFEASGDSKDGKLWLDAIKTTLDHVKPDDSAIDAEIERTLAELGHGRKAEAPGAAAGASYVAN